jgi:hypothetical protein
LTVWRKPILNPNKEWIEKNKKVLYGEFSRILAELGHCDAAENNYITVWLVETYVNAVSLYQAAKRMARKKGVNK